MQCSFFFRRRNVYTLHSFKWQKNSVDGIYSNLDKTCIDVVADSRLQDNSGMVVFKEKRDIHS